MLNNDLLYLLKRAEGICQKISGARISEIGDTDHTNSFLDELWTLINTKFQVINTDSTNREENSTT